MALLLKTIHGRRYVYRAYRQGDRVVHRYVGSADRPDVIKLLAAEQETRSVPDHVRPLFWDTDSSKLSLRTHGRYIAERILEVGDMKAFRWLRQVYAGQFLLEICRSSRRLSKKSSNFWLLWLNSAG
jgi:hypothetical protein